MSWARCDGNHNMFVHETGTGRNCRNLEGACTRKWRWVGLEQGIVAQKSSPPCATGVWCRVNDVQTDLYRLRT